MGIAVGSILGGKLIKHYMRKVVVTFNFVAMIGCLISVIKNYEVICFGRFIHGLSAGVLSASSSTLLGGTVPPHLSDMGYSSATNFAIAVGILGAQLLGIGIPLSDHEKYESSYWRAFYLFPIPLCLIAQLLFFTIYKFEATHFYSKKGLKSELNAHLSNIYNESSDTIE